ncbi:endoglucanase 1 [Lentinula boryana]|uniref:cellulase n=1 Tax=Lentinula boryana TaxID=40481 RepID=A0ABQ8QBV1_9AGAR|nr:endoglucanase 1 [Lentinula boryana]
MFLTKPLRLVLQSTTIVAILAACVGATILYAGVNESGGEFGVFGSPGTGLPGEFGVTYDFITESTVDTFVDTNQINFFRVTFLMERMCPLATGLGSTFNETYFSEYEDAINYITVTKGAYALIDPHNYMARRVSSNSFVVSADPSFNRDTSTIPHIKSYLQLISSRFSDPSSQPNSGSIIGDTTDPNAATTEQFQEFWTELASRFVDNPQVVFGINNEPHDMATSLILQNDQAAINGIRSTGATQLILAPGNGFTGGHSWTQVTGANDDPSSEWLNQIVDPLNNTAIDIHEYLDEDFSGSHDTCTQPGPSNLAALTTWLQENNLKAIVSEFGGSNDPTCLELVPELINYLSENDVYIGWSAWAAGPFWGTNSPCCGPEVGSLEPGQLDEEGGPNGYTTVWQAVIQPNINLSDLKRSGVSSLS